MKKVNCHEPFVVMLNLHLKINQRSIFRLNKGMGYCEGQIGNDRTIGGWGSCLIDVFQRSWRGTSLSSSGNFVVLAWVIPRLLAFQSTKSKSDPIQYDPTQFALARFMLGPGMNYESSNGTLNGCGKWAWVLELNQWVGVQTGIRFSNYLEVSIRKKRGLKSVLGSDS